MQKDQMPVHRFKKYEELGLTSKDFEQNYRKSRIGGDLLSCEFRN